MRNNVPTREDFAGGDVEVPVLWVGDEGLDQVLDDPAEGVPLHVAHVDLAVENGRITSQIESLFGHF